MDSLTDPHLKFPQVEASDFLLHDFLTESLGAIARLVFLFSVAFSNPSWHHILLSVLLPGAHFKKYVYTFY